MSRSIKIYIPSTTHENEPLPPGIHERYVDEALERFSRIFGGATSIDGEGAWLNEEGKLVKEEVTIVYSFAPELKDKAIEEIFTFARMIKVELKQSSVSLEVDGCMHFID